jgi:hypothetical protein
MSTNHKKSGAVDGGTGRGVRIGGTDTGRGPTGWDANRSVGSDPDQDDDETTPVADAAEFDEFFESDDDSPERRRDPLRRP